MEVIITNWVHWNRISKRQCNAIDVDVIGWKKVKVTWVLKSSVPMWKVEMKNLKGIGSRVSDKETKNQPSSRVDNIFPRGPGLLIVSNICKYQYVTTIYSWCGLLQEVDEKSKGYEENGVGWWERRQSSYFSPVLPLPPIILDRVVMIIVMTMTMIMMMISDIWWWIIINDNDKDDGKENGEPPSEPAWPCPHCRWWPQAQPPPWQDFWQHLPPDHHHHCYYLQNLNLWL